MFHRTKQSISFLLLALIGVVFFAAPFAPVHAQGMDMPSDCLEHCLDQLEQDVVAIITAFENTTTDQVIESADSHNPRSTNAFSETIYTSPPRYTEHISILSIQKRE